MEGSGARRWTGTARWLTAQDIRARQPGTSKVAVGKLGLSQAAKPKAWGPGWDESLEEDVQGWQYPAGAPSAETRSRVRV